MGYPVSLPREYLEFQLVQKMGWTYQELDETPAHRVEEAMAFMRVETRHQKFEDAPGRRN